MFRVAVLVVAAVAAGFVMHAFAQSRFDTRPAATPIGTSSSNGVSFAWFYDPSERTVYVCRAGSGETLECKAKAQLP